MKKFINTILLLSLLISLSCLKNSSTNPSTTYPFLKKEADYKLFVKEPSGLSLSVDGNFLWTVSDQTNKVYQLTLTGVIIKKLLYKGKIAFRRAIRE